MKFSLIIPCYNEEANLPLLLERCKELIAKVEAEVILVDNGSSDGTHQVLLNLLPRYSGFRTVRVEKNQGYGYGILLGLRAAKGEIIGWTHADLQTDPLDTVKGLEIFEKYGKNVFVKGYRCGRPLADDIFTVGMSIFETLLFGRPMWDINAQPTMFTHEFFKSWNSPPNDFSLDLYAYHLAQSKGLKVYRFPVKFGERAHGISHWNVNWAAKWKFIRRTIDYSLQLKKKIFS